MLLELTAVQELLISVSMMHNMHALSRKTCDSITVGSIKATVTIRIVQCLWNEAMINFEEIDEIQRISGLIMRVELSE